MLTRPPDKPRPDAKRQRASAAAERRRAWPQTFDLHPIVKIPPI